MEITQNLKALLSEMRNISSSETVIGEPIRVGEATIGPVNRLGLGCGVAAGAAAGSAVAVGGTAAAKTQGCVLCTR